MGKRFVALFMVMLLGVGIIVPTGGSDEGGSDRGIQDLDDYSEWTDPLDDMSRVYVPPGGLIGVEVASGEVSLLPGNSTGWVASSAIACPVGLRYDYLLLEVDTPGNSTVEMSILDPSQDSIQVGYANRTIPGFIDMEGAMLSLYGVVQNDYPEIRVQVNLFADGTDLPRLLSWSVTFCDAELWHDPFIGLKRDSAHGNLHLGDGIVKPVDPIVSGGLKGSYYDNMDLTDFKYSNPHEVVDFDWGYDSPAGLGSNTFSISWEGYVRINKAESYTFYVRSDDGCRLWIDERLLIDKWVDQSPTEWSTTLHLEPGYYKVRLDYYENTLGALCEFRYSSPSISKMIVPAEVLYAGGISSLVSETIVLPQGHKWDLLMVERIEGTEGSIYVDVIDAYSNVSIYGCTDILKDHLDLTTVNMDSHPAIRLKARWNVTNVSGAPSLSHWLVKWMKIGMWRDQFHTDTRVEQLMNLRVEDGMLASIDQGRTAPMLMFAGLFDDSGSNVRSYAYLDGGGLDYLSTEPIAFDVWGASSIDVADVNGDGHPDVAFSVYQTSGAAHSTTSPLFLGSSVGWLPRPHHSFPTTGATSVLLEDLNGDGHTDVVFAQEQDGGDYYVNSTLFWGSAAGWNATPDVNFTTTGASDVKAADFDMDGDLDLVFACYSATSTQTDSMVFLQTTSGFDGTSATYSLPTKGARAVAAEDLDGDMRIDFVFANSFSTGMAEINSSIYWGKIGGGFAPEPTELPTVGASDVEVADLDGDGDLDIVFANSIDNDGSHYVDSYVYLNSGAGAYSSTPDVLLPTIGASGVAARNLDGTGWMDLVFASLTDGSGQAVPSPVFLGNSSGWNSTPDLELPMKGASDVLIPDLPRVGVGGYLSMPITPEDRDDTGTFHTFGYTANLSASQDGTIQLIDADSYEVLAETTLRSGYRTWVVEDIFTVRDHPRIRARIVVEELEGAAGFWLDDLWINWTKRVRKAPVVHDIQLEASSVYRTEAVALLLNVSDEYDDAADLIVTVEHRLNGTDDWRDGMLGSLSFSNDAWRIGVTPWMDTITGSYDFRVSAMDTDRLDSGFTVFPNVLLVLNNIPTAPSVSIVPTSPDTTSVLRVEIDSPSRDVEGSGLTYRYQWSLDGEPVDGFTNETVFPSHTQKGQNWSVEVRAWDDEDESPPALAWTVIQNAAPRIRNLLPDPELDEDTTDEDWIDLSGAFEDPDGDTIGWSVAGESGNITITIDPASGRVTIAPIQDWFGEETVTFVASDGELTARQTVTIHVLSVNDVPTIDTVDGEPVTSDIIEYTIQQGTELVIRYTVSDVEGDEVQATVTSAAVEHDEEARTIRFAPGKDEVGTLTFTLRINDVTSPSEKVTLDFNVTVENKNDPMEVPTITSPDEGDKFKVNQSFSLIAICEDPDVPLGQVLNYTWESNLSGLLGYGSSLYVKLSEPGIHLVTVTVRDPDFTESVSMTIIIEPIEDVTPPEPPEEDPETEDINWLLIVGVVVALVIVGAAFFVMATRRRTDELEVADEDEYKREHMERAYEAVKAAADQLEEEKAKAEEDEWVEEAEIEDIDMGASAGRLSMEARVTERDSGEVERLWDHISEAETERTAEERETLRIEDLKRKYQNAIGTLPYGVPSKELADCDWMDLAAALATGKKKTVEGDREVTMIDGKWYYSDYRDSSTFLKEHGARPKEAPRKADEALATVDQAKLMAKLEERFIMGEISEDTYKQLMKKYGDKE